MKNEPNQIKIIVGENIKKYRKLRGVSQEKLSELVSISTSAMSCIERGKSYPEPETLGKIVNVLNIELNKIFIDNNIKNYETALEDFNKRFDLIKKDKTKFEILYNVLKVLS